MVFLMVNPYILTRFPQFARELSDELRGSANPQPWARSTFLLTATGIGIPCAAVMLGAAWLALLRKSREGLFILLGFGVPALLLLAGRPAMARYLMPALPLPVFILAWSFDLLQRKGAARPKRAARAAAPLLLAALLLITGFQTLSFCMLFSAKECDTRTAAGEAIFSAVPAGATIGVLSADGGDPWQFELPPLNPQRNKIELVSLSLDDLNEKRPDYFVCSDLQFPPVAVRGPLDASEERFHKAVTTSADGYIVMQTFEAWPSGWSALLAQGPHDMRYPNPVIVISRRAGAEAK